MMDWTDRHCRVFHRLMKRPRAFIPMASAAIVELSQFKFRDA